MTIRLSPLTPPYEPEIDEALQRLMGRRPDVEPLALFRTIAHHPALLERFRQTGSTLLSSGGLPAVDRETVIHRTTARCGAAYEWGVHDDDAALVELVCLAGFYRLISYVCRAFGVQPETWAAPAPAA